MDFDAFARDWQSAWNAHDLPRLLSHYRDDIVFRSPKAALLTGDGTIRGKPALAAYWGRALALQPELAFRVLAVFSGHDTVVISYLNHRDVPAAETLQFDAAGLVRRGSACYAAPTQRAPC